MLQPAPPPPPPHFPEGNVIMSAECSDDPGKVLIVLAKVLGGAGGPWPAEGRTVSVEWLVVAALCWGRRGVSGRPLRGLRLINMSNPVTGRRSRCTGMRQAAMEWRWMALPWVPLKFGFANSASKIA